jgi:hypothetical protein
VSQIGYLLLRREENGLTVSKIINLTKQKEQEKREQYGIVGEKRRKINRRYYVRNAAYLTNRQRIKRKKEPKPQFKYVDGKLMEFYPISFLAWKLRITTSSVRRMEVNKTIPKTPFIGGKKRLGYDRLYTKEMVDIIVTCYEVARTVCGKSNFTEQLRTLLKKKWLDAEINSLW